MISIIGWFFVIIFLFIVSIPLLPIIFSLLIVALSYIFVFIMYMLFIVSLPFIFLCNLFSG